MSDPLVFDDSSPRLGLPYLFAGQSQKEVFVTEAHARLDALIHCAIESVETSPPALPEEGEMWVVGSGADGDWLGRDHSLALFRGGGWQYILPVDGIYIAGGWNANSRSLDWTGPAISGGMEIGRRFSGTFGWYVR
jgi:hypothetical protein